MEVKPTTRNMLLEDALDVLREIAEGDKEREAFEIVEHAVGAYRSLYESAERRIQRYRDVSGRPDIFENVNATVGVRKEKHTLC